MFGQKKDKLARFRARFGQNPLEQAGIHAARERLAQVRIFHEVMKKPDDYDEYSMDDVTWSDLEMDEVFLRINNTRCYIGEQVLYETLHSGSTDFFRQNRDWMEKLAEDESSRLELEYRLDGAGKKQESYYLPEFFGSAGMLGPEHTWVYRILQIILECALLLAIVFRTTPFFILLACSSLVNFIVYIHVKMKHDVLLSSIGGLGGMLDVCSWCLNQKEIPLPVENDLRLGWEKVKGLRRKIGKFVYARQSSVSGDPIGLLYVYLLGITLIDVSRLSGILKMIEENRETVEKLYRFVGRMDTAISILSFRESVPTWCHPEMEETGDVGERLKEAPAVLRQAKMEDTSESVRESVKEAPAVLRQAVMEDTSESAENGQQGSPEGAGKIRAAGLYHPLLRSPVCNDFCLTDRAIITGANASGKSTFMKALAVNTVRAQTIDTCCAESFSLPAMKVMTSMAIRDDVVTGESYYVREVKYLKRMLDVIASGKRTLCIIDEILKGTNQKERLAASEAVLSYIARCPGYCIIATHDLELVEKLKDKYVPYFFESIIEQGTVTFNYKIKPGLGGDTNALALLRAFDFPGEILEEAYARV